VPSRAEVHPERANAVFNHMVAENVPRTEMTYTALARVEAAVGEPQRALALVARLREERLVPKLRTYAPALHAFCARDDVEGADRCASAISRDDAGLELGESEYAALMDLYARNIATEGSSGGGDGNPSVVERGFGRLRELAETVRAVGEDLAGSIARFFDAAPGWATQAEVAVDVASGSGTAAPSGRTIQLRAVHLSAEDRARLLAGIGKLAREREVADAFGGFARWLRRRGPLPFLVDGANVGMFNQNFKESAFRFDQVERVVKRLRPEAKAIRKARLEAMKAEAKTKAGAKEEDERGDDADPEEDKKSGGGEGGDLRGGTPRRRGRPRESRESRRSPPNYYHHPSRVLPPALLLGPRVRSGGDAPRLRRVGRGVALRPAPLRGRGRADDVFTRPPHARRPRQRRQGARGAQGLARRRGAVRDPRGE
jgi:proteinaceous RNase P